MSKKYIKQIDNQNFVFPNNNLAEYDIEIIHDLNNNSVSGDINTFTTTAVGGNIQFSFNYNWYKNNAEPYIDASGELHILSVHMLEPSRTYYKPWRCVTGVTTSNIGISTTGGTVNCTVTPSMMGIVSFGSGTYSFEVRMIGKRAIYPLCNTSTLNPPTPTPTPTPTITPSPTPTTTVEPPTPTPTPTPTGGPYYYTGLICGGSIVEYFYSNTDLGDNPGVVYAYSATAGGTYQCFDNVNRTSTTTSNPIIAVYGDCVSCANPSCTSWKIQNDSGITISWNGVNCGGTYASGTVDGRTTGFTPCLIDGSLRYTGSPLVTVDGYC